MVQEELGEKTQMLAINLAEMAIDFKYRDVVLSVNLIARRLRIPAAFGDVAFENPSTLHVFQAKLADEEFRQARVFLGVWRRIPSLNLIDAEFDGRGIPAR